jgi:hypothetical protein
VSNIECRYLEESEPYVPISRRNIGHGSLSFLREFRHLTRFGAGTENPRVGGSIPSLATI